MQRVAVLGSNSFSGSDLIDLLLDDPDTEVIGISRSPEKSALFLPYRSRVGAAFRFHQADLNHDIPRIVDILDDFRPTAIVNFAAQSEVAPSWDHPEHWYETNVVSLARLTSALVTRSYLQRYVQISSPELYGSCGYPVREDHPPNPSTPYAASKAAADLHLSSLVKQFSFPCVTVRATNVYGAHQQLWKIIPRSVILLMKGERIALHGGGKAVKSYIHIRDVSRAELVAIERGVPGTVYHVAPDRGYAVREVVERICTIMGRDFGTATMVVPERPGQDGAYVLDSSRTREEFGWSPEFDLAEGLAGVVRWVEDNWQAIQSEDLEYVHRA